MMNPTTTCPECGAVWEGSTCTDHFHKLLALDHRRLQPWGRYHGLNVACFLLQHPSQADDLGTPWRLIAVFLTDGIEGVNALEERLVAGDLPSFDNLAEPVSVPDRVRTASVTIGDVIGVSARGYEERMQLWALSIAAERGHASAA